jgi:hypothetical protein
MDKLITIISSSGMVAFGFLAYNQAKVILTAQNEIICYDDVGFTDIWVPEIALLVGFTMIASILFTTLILQDR